MANLNPNVYGNGTTTASAGANTITHYYDKAGVKAANAVNVYQQFASKKTMPQRMGKTYKISKFLHLYDRNKDTDTDFAAKGYMTSRSIDDINTKLAAAAMSEGEGVHNEVSIEKITMEGTFARFGKMISYTDEVELFSEDEIQVRYREELGGDMGVMNEDLIQRDMLSTPTKLYAGYATAMVSLGEDSDADGVATDALHKVSYNLIRKAAKKLKRNRARQVTSIVSGSTKVGTTPVAASHYAIINTDVKSDLENLTRGSGAATEYVYTPVHKYGSAGSMAEGEVGQMHETIFIESESAIIYPGAGALVRPWIGNVDGLPYATEALANADVNDASTQVDEYTGTLAFTGEQGDGSDDTAGSELNNAAFDVYPILYPTKDAFATIGLKGKDRIKFGSIDPQVISATNPYGTKGFFSANFWYASIILEPEKLLRVDVLASA